MNFSLSSQVEHVPESPVPAPADVPPARPSALHFDDDDPRRHPGLLARIAGCVRAAHEAGVPF